MIVPDNIQKGEKDVKSVENVEGNKEKIETNLVLKGRHRILNLHRMLKVLMQTFRRRTNIESTLPITPNPPMMNINTPDIQQ